MRFKKGDKIAMTMVVVKDFDTRERESGEVVIDNNPSAIRHGSLYFDYTRFDGVKESDIVRAPVPLAAGQVWVDKVGDTRTIVFVDDQTVLYDLTDKRKLAVRHYSCTPTFKGMVANYSYTLQD